ncbi:NAD(P)-binding protein [Cadophora sp. DSE1049]|nr:NAD(P)-binding protein [Cadophora sp. DSE1049]
MAVVVVWRGTGFVATHLILQLLTAGYKVRTTLRTISSSSSLLQILKEAGLSPETISHLSFFKADLTKDESWTEAIQGCTHIHHHVIMTSSFAAIGYGHPPQSEPFTETSWSDLTSKPALPAYHRSKTLAERAGWDFTSSLDSEPEVEGKPNLELTVLNPVGIFGPILSEQVNSSVQIIQKLLDGSIPACPQIKFGIVDVRDFAALYILAMLDPTARNERFIAANDAGAVSMIGIARIIRDGRSEGNLTEKVPTRQLWNWIVWFAGLFVKEMGAMVPPLGEVKNASNGKAKSVLGWKPRNIKDTMFETVDSLVKFGVV